MYIYMCKSYNSYHLMSDYVDKKFFANVIRFSIFIVKRIHKVFHLKGY